MPNDCYKDQREICKQLWKGDIQRLEERFVSTDKALTIQQTEIQRRMHEANEIKKEFGNKVILIEQRVSALETRSVVWIGVIIFAFTILEIFLRFYK
jgi:hypothetical protein